ncbi:MAG: glycosyltransferase family 4 protein [candidate division WOR-3 bacterium]
MNVNFQKRICIAFFSHSAECYGAEKSLVELLEGLKARGIEILVLLPSDGPLTKKLEQTGFQYRIFPFKWWASNKSLWTRVIFLLWNLLLLFPICIFVLKRQVDAIYTNSAVVSIGALVAVILRKPHIWHIHEIVDKEHGLTFDFGEALSLRIIDWVSRAVITNSEFVSQKYSRYISQKKINLIYYGISVPSEKNLDSIYSSTPDKFKIAIIGNINRTKNQMDAVQAVDVLKKRGLKLALYIVGNGDESYTNQIKQYVREHGLEEDVYLMGYVENPFPLICNSDILLMCSLCEAFGRVTVESMLMGKPVIGTKSGGTKEIIHENFNGYFYTPGNYIELAQKIEYLINNPEVRKQMGENGCKWAKQKFPVDRYPEEVFSVIKDIIKYK